MSEKKESNLELCHLLPVLLPPFLFLYNQLELLSDLHLFWVSFLLLQLDLPIKTPSIDIGLFYDFWLIRKKKKKKKKKQAVMDRSLLPKPDQEVSKELKPENQASKRRCVGVP
jgi:hypothetical protein